MDIYWILGVALLCIFVLIISYYVYSQIFASSKKIKNLAIENVLKTFNENDKQRIKVFMENFKKYSFEEIVVKSYDGLNLYGRYFEFYKNAPIKIIFHGYKSNSNLDCSALPEIAQKRKYNVLIVDQRAHGKSEGRTITFGVKERYDVVSWVNYVVNRFGENQKILLSGISMGAFTVLSSLGLNLPKNIKGVISDCSYSSPKEIIKKVIKDRKLPPNLIYPFVKLGAKIFGGFNIDSVVIENCIKNSSVPILVVHGKKDSFVPCYMGEKLYSIINGDKKLFLVEEADHAMSYITSEEEYLKVLQEFEDKLLME